MQSPPKDVESQSTGASEAPLQEDAVHTLNELLTVIAGYAELSRELMPPESAAAQYQNEILRAAEVATKLALRLARRPLAATLAAGPRPAPTPPEDLPGARPAWTRRVLLVDDDAAVRKFTSAILALNGFDVTAVETGHDAIQACEAHEGWFGLVISDIVMSPLNGIDLITTLGDRWPTLPKLLISGYPGAGVEPQDRYGRQIPFLSKPYTNFQLLAKVRSIMAADPRAIPA